MTLTPRSLSELQEAVAASAPAPLAIRGGGTKHLAARRGAVLVDTRALTGIVSYNPAECVVTALGGTPVRQIDATLAAHGQYLPFDPPLARAGATLGGTVAAGASGPGRYRYGGIRDFVIGAAVVDGDGRLVRSGGQVVKNAAGFLLHHGLVGSGGRYGVVGEVSLKVFPRPEARLTLRLRSATLAEALDRHQRLRGAVTDLEALDVDLTGLTVWARLAGAATALPRRAERARQALDGTALDILEGAAEARAWEDAAELTWAPPGSTIVKVASTPGRLGHLVAVLTALGPVRGTSGGAALLLATSRPVAEVQAALPAEARAVVLRGADCGRVLGRGQGNVFDERVRRSLDPAGRFA
jgi:glycolate oxidase FAD binding subunit